MKKNIIKFPITRCRKCQTPPPFSPKAQPIHMDEFVFNRKLKLAGIPVGTKLPANIQLALFFNNLERASELFHGSSFVEKE